VGIIKPIIMDNLTITTARNPIPHKRAASSTSYKTRTNTPQDQ